MAGPPPGPPDQYFRHVAALMHFNGTNGSTNFIDSSAVARAMTNHNQAQISTAQSKFGGSSGLFDGSGDYVRSLSGFSFGTGDFTVECWVRFGDTGTNRAILAGIGNGSLDLTFVGNEFRIGRINTAFDSAWAWTRAINTWYHLAICRKNGQIRFFIDGTQIGSTASNSISYTATSGFYVGASTTTDRSLLGYMDELRVTVGYARYTANFAVPTEPFSNTGPALEDLSAYVQGYASGALTVLPASYTYQSYRYQTNLLYADKGVDHFDGDLCIDFDTTVSSIAPGGVSGQIMLSNAIGHSGTQTDFLHAFIYYNGSNITLRLVEAVSGSQVTSALYNIGTGQERFCRLRRDMSVGANGTVYLHIALSDANRISGIWDATLSIALRPLQQFRYMYAFWNLNDGNGAVANGNGKNYRINYS